MIEVKDSSQCCGCSACASICGRKAITMCPDVLGFLYPKIDVNKCVECGLCEKVCAFHNDYDISSNFSCPEIYAARHKDIKEIEKSRSGAMFVALSDWVINCGGVIYGAGYTDHFRVIHKRATTHAQRDEFRGSKYVQSDMGHVFCEVEEDLRAGKVVLFTGTPCQTSGLQSFLKLKHVPIDLLYVVDIVCHGVPGPYLWRDYLAYIEKNRVVKFWQSISVTNRNLDGLHIRNHLLLKMARHIHIHIHSISILCFVIHVANAILLTFNDRQTLL